MCYPFVCFLPWIGSARFAGNSSPAGAGGVQAPQASPTAKGGGLLPLPVGVVEGSSRKQYAWDGRRLVAFDRGQLAEGAPQPWEQQQRSLQVGWGGWGGGGGCRGQVVCWGGRHQPGTSSSGARGVGVGQGRGVRLLVCEVGWERGRWEGRVV